MRGLEIEDSGGVDPCPSISHSRPHSPSEAGRKTRPLAFVTQRVTATLIAKTSTWGGVHPHSRILLPQADMREPFRLNRSTSCVDQRQHIFIHKVSSRTSFVDEP